MNLTPEQRQVGRQNYYNALGVSRRDVLKSVAVAPAAGAFYYGYSELEDETVRAGLIGTGSQGNLLLSVSNPDFLRFEAYSEIRPSQIQRVRNGDAGDPMRLGFLRKYNMSETQFEQEVRYHKDYRELLDNPDLDLVVIALPLHLHFSVVREALDAGKHVFCEAPLAETGDQCKQLANLAREKNLVLSTGHHRHYSMLYDNALSLIEDGVLGDVQHVRAFWHRNHSWPRLDNATAADGSVLYDDPWQDPIPAMDANLDYQSYGYDSLEELCWWRLHRRMGGGLMTELGSHQLEVCSLLLGGVHPLAVSGVGGGCFFDGQRDIDDQVFATFEFPGHSHPQGKHAGNNADDIVVVTFSAISSNSIDGYGEQIMGSRGTMFVEQEQNVMLFKEPAPGEKATRAATEISLTLSETSQPAIVAAESDSSGSAGAGWAQAATVGNSSRGYREELEHLAWCIRNPSAENQPRCSPAAALATATYAQVANQAIRQRRRIEFQPEWFDLGSDEVPLPEEDLLAGR